MNGISPIPMHTPRFGSNIPVRQLESSMKKIGFHVVRGGRHPQLTNGKVSLPFSDGGKINTVGDKILASMAQVLGVPLKDFKAFLQNPKRNSLELPPSHRTQLA